jgi:CRISPR-associated endonuclease/helicase Cas3
MKILLGKSDGTTLKNHSELVSKVAVMIYDITASHIDDKLRESIRIAGLLHDIGKCTDFFQKKLKSLDSELLIESGQPKKYPFRHNEVGYAFLFNHLKSDKIYDKKIILDAVYWHHGVTPDNFHKDTVSYINQLEISKVDSETMLEFINDVLDENMVDAEPYMIQTVFNRLSYFTQLDDFLNDDNNPTKLLARNCVISADKIVSSGCCEGLSDFDLMELVRTFNNKNCTIDVNTHTYNTTNQQRFNSQLDIAKSIVNDNQNNTNTHIVKAPAGFGKTIVGLLWSLSSNKRLIWVCPRNDVAQSVYNTILNELNGFDNGSSVSVELYLTGEIVEQTHNQSGFDSDIIVTNIDNFLNPSVDNRYSHRLFTVLESDVIFDEYHELVGDASLFALFVYIMKLRATYTKSSTVLLSATPSLIEFLWDNINKKTKLLPNINEHFKPQHNKEYELSVVDDIINPPTNTSSVTILNSVTNAQKFKKENRTQHLYHSLYTKSDRSEILARIFNLYGKNSERLPNKDNVAATHVLQASLDLSFNHLYESVLSPESTLQRFGRCDRFGDYLPQSTLTIFKNIPNLDKGENAIRSKLYSVNLTNIWFDFIKSFNGQRLTLEQLYLIYNEFNNKNSKIIKNHIMSKFIESSNRLSELYPIRLFIKGKSKVKTAGGNKLRSTNGNEIFVIAQYYNNPERYSDPITVDTYNNFTETFREDGSSLHKIIRQQKRLRDMNDVRFDFNNMIDAHKHNSNKLTLDNIRYHAKREDKPYIRFDKVYHPDYGFVDPYILK